MKFFSPLGTGKSLQISEAQSHKRGNQKIPWYELFKVKVLSSFMQPSQYESKICEGGKSCHVETAEIYFR